MTQRKPYLLACEDCQFGVVWWLRGIATEPCRWCLYRWAWEALVLAGPSTS